MRKPVVPHAIRPNADDRLDHHGNIVRPNGALTLQQRAGRCDDVLSGGGGDIWVHSAVHQQETRVPTGGLLLESTFR